MGIDFWKIRNNKISWTGENGALEGGPACTFCGKKYNAIVVVLQARLSIQQSLPTCSNTWMQTKFTIKLIKKTHIFILDGHHSHMDVEILAYVNETAHECFVCLGVPYSKHTWQLVDSSQINGVFKIQSAKTNCGCLWYKNNNQSLTETDIVTIVKTAFSKGFANVVNTQKAIDKGSCWTNLYLYTQIMHQLHNWQNQAAIKLSTYRLRLPISFVWNYLFWRTLRRK